MQKKNGQNVHLKWIKTETVTAPNLSQKVVFHEISAEHLGGQNRPRGAHKEVATGVATSSTAAGGDESAEVSVLKEKLTTFSKELQGSQMEILKWKNETRAALQAKDKAEADLEEAKAPLAEKTRKVAVLQAPLADAY